jgi:uncharacterized membrane protein
MRKTEISSANFTWDTREPKEALGGRQAAERVLAPFAANPLESNGKGKYPAIVPLLVRVDSTARDAMPNPKRDEELTMSDLIVIGYENPFQAEEVRLKLLKLQRDYLIDLEDAVVAVRDADGKVRLNQIFKLTQAGAVGGGFWGALIGMLFLNPLLGAAVGAGAGAISGALSDVGINDDFMKNLAQTFKPGTSALFVLVRKATPDKVLDELGGSGGKIIQTSLSHDDEAKLQAALDAAKSTS